MSTKRGKDYLERRFADSWAMLYPELIPRREYRFHPHRKWRFDFAWPPEKVAVEIEGGIWSPNPGRHNRASGFVGDCEKYNAAVHIGWRVLRFTDKQLRDVAQCCELLADVLTKASIEVCDE